MRTGVYRDESFPFSGVKIYSPSSKVGYNYTNMSVFFDKSAADVDADAIFGLLHLNHYYQFGTPIKPHLHWIQEEANVPAFIMKYRVNFNGGALDTTWKTLSVLGNAFTYTSGSINQITFFEDIPAVEASDGVSAMIDLRYSRDGAADSYTGQAYVKQFDAHIQQDSMGSYYEFKKTRMAE